MTPPDQHGLSGNVRLPGACRLGLPPGISNGMYIRRTSVPQVQPIHRQLLDPAINGLFNSALEMEGDTAINVCLIRITGRQSTFVTIRHE
jgi:hypothetical protein